MKEIERYKGERNRKGKWKEGDYFYGARLISVTRVWKISVLVARWASRRSTSPPFSLTDLKFPPPTRPTSSWKAVFVFRGGISRQFAFDRRLGLKSLGDKTFWWWLDFCRLEWAAASGSTNEESYIKSISDSTRIIEGRRRRKKRRRRRRRNRFLISGEREREIHKRRGFINYFESSNREWHTRIYVFHPSDLFFSSRFSFFTCFSLRFYFSLFYFSLRCCWVPSEGKFARRSSYLEQKAKEETFFFSCDRHVTKKRPTIIDLNDLD